MMSARFAPDGTFLDKWDGGSVALLNPRGIAVTSEGFAWVSDTDNSRLVVFGPNAPDTWRGEYFANRWLADAPVYIHNDADLTLAWAEGSPGGDVPSENWSARWERDVTLDDGLAVFSVDADGAVRVWVDGKIVIQRLFGSGTATGFVPLTAGRHRVRLEYAHEAGAASVALRWQTSSVGNFIFLPYIER